MTSSTSIKPEFLKVNVGLGLILAFGAVSAVVAFSGFAKILNYAFPLGATLLGFTLYSRYPLLYNGFTWWIWFLSPFVRRIVDYNGGFSNPSPILLTPYLVTLISSLTLLKYLPNIHKLSATPYAISLAGVAYGYLIGVLKESIVPATIGLFDWVSPIIFGFHLFINWRYYPDYQRNTQRAFLWFVLVAGLYGIFQFLVAPEWDTYWLRNVTDLGNTSFGRPEPLQIRVWSILHGPGVFGFGMFAGLLLLLTSSSPLYLPATLVGYLSFLLSQVRSAWLAWFMGLMFLLAGLKPKFQIRLFIFGIVALACVVPLTSIEPFSEVIGDRLSTLSDVSNDKSAADRQSNYAAWLGYAVSNFLGDGIGSTRDILLDSAILDSLISLGIFGCVFYCMGLAMLIFHLTTASNKIVDPFISASRAIVLSLFSQVFLGSIMVEFPGMLLWGFLGIGLAGQKYYLNINAQNK